MADDLPLVGGHVALDMLNTLEPRLPDGLERLAAPTVLLNWARRTAVLSDADASAVARAWDADPPAADAALTDVHALRDTTSRALAGEPAALAALTARWASAMSRSALEPAAGGPGAVLSIGTDPALRIADRLADAAVDLLRSDLGRLKACPLDEGGCGWLFLDRSRNGSRRWCSMEDCGTHNKSRRLTERRRARRASAGS
jgi:predicted RNA-binding Zn ribbon-like protein